MSIDFWSTPQGKLGRRGEDLVSLTLKHEGWVINRTSDYSGPNGDMAPRLSDIGGFFAVTPDIDAAKRGKRRWVEVKSKTKPAWVRAKRWEGHGISELHLSYYEKVGEETGSEVWIMIYEADKNNILSAPLAALLAGPSHLFDGDGALDSVTGGNRNFPRRSFTLFGIPPTGNEIFSILDSRWRLGWSFKDAATGIEWPGSAYWRCLQCRRALAPDEFLPNAGKLCEACLGPEAASKARTARQKRSG